MTLKIKAVKPAVLDAIRAKVGDRATESQWVKAVKLVVDGKVERLSENVYRVQSQSDAAKSYTLVRGHGVCTCEWSVRYPAKMCAHRLAATILYAVVQAPVRQQPVSYEQKAAAHAYDQYQAEGGELVYEAWAVLFAQWSELQTAFEANKANWTPALEAEATKLEEALCL